MRYLSAQLKLAVVFGFACAAHILAGTLYVDVSNKNPVSPFDSWKTASIDIQEALDVAVDGDTILVTNGTYSIFQQVNVVKGVTLRSVNGSELTVIRANADGNPSSCYRVMKIDNSNAVIDGFGITGGNMGLYAYGGGGGVYITTNGGLVKNCDISGNASTDDGAGVRCEAGKLLNCSISKNGGFYYGGVHCSGGATIDGCRIYGNGAARSAGGVWLVESSIRNSTVISNSSEYAGGILCRTGVVENCLVARNTAFGYGGIRFEVGEIRNSTIVDNYAQEGGGGVIGCDVMVNTIVVSNRSYAGNLYLYGETNVSISHCCVDPAPSGIECMTNYPDFVDYEGMDYRLTSGSSCIDAGATNDFAVDDMTFTTRPVDGDGDGIAAPDIGAFEFTTNSPPVNVCASTGLGTNLVRITWDAVPGASIYDLWRSTIPHFCFALSLQRDVTNTAYNDTTVLPNKGYYYWVKTDVSSISASACGYYLELEPVYRLYSYGSSISTYEHLWTTSETEKDVLDSWSSWQYEGIAWYAITSPAPETVPLYRLYCPSKRQHHYTIDTSEYAVLTAGGSWSGEGVQYYVYPTNTPGDLCPVYRFYHADLCLHHFTISEEEMSAITNHPKWGYAYEGIGYYVFATNVTGSGLRSEGSRFTVHGSELRDENSGPVPPQTNPTFSQKDMGAGNSAVPRQERHSADRAHSHSSEENVDSLSTLATEHCLLNTEFTPVPGDYDGDGNEDIAYYDEPTGIWYLLGFAESSSPYSLQPAPRSSRRRGAFSLTWGGPGLLPFSIDYDADGISDLGVYDEETLACFILSLDGRILVWDESVW